MNSDSILDFIIFLVPLATSFVLIMKKESSIERKMALIAYFITIVSFGFLFLYYGDEGALRTINDVFRLVVVPTLLIGGIGLSIAFAIVNYAYRDKKANYK